MMRMVSIPTILMLSLQGCIAAPTDSYYFRKDGQKITLSPLQTRSKTASFSYRNAEGQTVTTDGTILAGCKLSSSECQAVFQTFGIASARMIAPGIYAITPKDTNSCFALSRKLFSHPAITFAHPNFTTHRDKR